MGTFKVNFDSLIECIKCGKISQLAGEREQGKGSPVIIIWLCGLPADEAGGQRGIWGSESYYSCVTVRDVYSVKNTLYVQSPVIVDLNQSSRKREAHKTCSLINFDSLVGKQVVLYIHKPEF